MLMDFNTVFSNAQAVTVSAVSTNTYDFLQGLGIASVGGTYPTSTPNSIIGQNATFFGEDLGLGSALGEPRIVVSSGAGAPASGVSLQIAVQGAVDTGGGTMAGLTFVPYIQTRAIPAASILGSARLASISFPKREFGQGLPRFIQLGYTCGATWSGLTLNASITTGPDDSQNTLPLYPANF